MIAVDTNVLARFYIDDPQDPESKKQRPLARSALESSEGVFVPITVVLELEWVSRALYAFDAAAFARMIDHLVGLPNVTVEDWPAVLDAVALHQQGLDFADALHVVRSAHCQEFLTFDDRRLARRATAIGVIPRVSVPKARPRAQR
jgi:predicted nucleic-acid-binding protein